MQQRFAFTLLELIIVIAVIALLSALLLPVITQGRKKHNTLTISRLTNILPMPKSTVLSKERNPQLPDYRSAWWAPPFQRLPRCWGYCP